MANHASAKKRIRSTQKKRAKNKYQHKSARTFKKQFLQETDKEKATNQLPRMQSIFDKLVKGKIIHPNKSPRIKKQLHQHLRLPMCRCPRDKDHTIWSSLPWGESRPRGEKKRPQCFFPNSDINIAPSVLDTSAVADENIGGIESSPCGKQYHTQ